MILALKFQKDLDQATSVTLGWTRKHHEELTYFKPHKPVCLESWVLSVYDITGQSKPRVKTEECLCVRPT